MRASASSLPTSQAYAPTVAPAWSEAFVAEVPADLPLTELQAGRPALVRRVDIPGSLGDRLVELGFTPGASIELLRRAPLGGPLQVRIRDYVLSLRRSEARAVLVAAA